MLFNSVDFLLFLPSVFLLYWFVFKKIKFQNLFILFASYLFYGWWDWRFLFLILASTLVDYSIGLLLDKSIENKKRKYLLYTSLVFNLGLLGIFKYYNFFIDNWIYAWSEIGINMHKGSLNIILPVGISFYTFQTLSYSIDVYKKKINPTKNFIAFASFVSFFPQLVAGPIERASNLLPQFFKKREFSYPLATSGMKLILWGFFKKIVIADNCAVFANDIFNNYQDQSGTTLALGAVYFAFQIYGDFSGYSDIAIGVARLFGFKLMRNFNYPYFSRDIAEFWRRWHISLSTWFRDYLYIPLGGSRGSKYKKVRNVLIIFIVSGFWHGANWTFITWGALNAVYFLPLLLTNRNRNNTDHVSKNSHLPSIKTIFQILVTFFLTTFAWIFFRAENMTIALDYINRMFSIQDGKNIGFNIFNAIIIIFLALEWISRKSESIQIKNRYLRYLFYIIIIQTILFYSASNKPQDFIYFQF
tara:strand:- start:57017 stop:58435 length:1419 start_codon:yes stop_codon:yes gene_type:complete